jgi:two-component system, response regulator
MSKHTIYWADDDTDDIELFSEILQQMEGDHEVFSFPHGRALLEALREDQVTPCLIVLDLNMPILNGWETLEQLKKDPRWKTLHVVVLSTSAQERDRTFCARYDTPMLSKPTDYSKLHEVMQALLCLCDHREPVPSLDMLRTMSGQNGLR